MRKHSASPSEDGLLEVGLSGCSHRLLGVKADLRRATRLVVLGRDHYSCAMNDIVEIESALHQSAGVDRSAIARCPLADTAVNGLGLPAEHPEVTAGPLPERVACLARAFGGEAVVNPVQACHKREHRRT